MKMISKPVELTPLIATSRFQLPDYQSGSRSPSRSPNRRDRYAGQELDPLLSNLSPVSTLEALKANDAVSFEEGSKGKILSDSIADSSASERALGIRAALAGKRLREWCTEIQSWQWPEGKFEPPTENNRSNLATNNDHGGALDHAVSPKGPAANNQEGIYLGSLPLGDVEEIEQRMEAIKDGMETLEVEELKDHVRGAHLVPQSRPEAGYVANTVGSPVPKVNHLDDFTVVITATIMQALPWLSRLNSLLSGWYIRTVVLRQVPDFLQQLEDTQRAVGSAWNAISEPSSVPGSSHSDLTREAFSTTKGILQDRVVDLGQRLDAMLDVLEGSADRIPDHWIDRMEEVQEQYEEWVVRAEREVDQVEWLAQKKHAVEALTRMRTEKGPEIQRENTRSPGHASSQVKYPPMSTGKEVPLEPRSYSIVQDDLFQKHANEAEALPDPSDNPPKEPQAQETHSVDGMGNYIVNPETVDHTQSKLSYASNDGTLDTSSRNNEGTIDAHQSGSDLDHSRHKVDRTMLSATDRKSFIMESTKNRISSDNVNPIRELGKPEPSTNGLEIQHNQGYATGDGSSVFPTDRNEAPHLSAPYSITDNDTERYKAKTEGAVIHPAVNRPIGGQDRTANKTNDTSIEEPILSPGTVSANTNFLSTHKPTPLHLVNKKPTMQDESMSSEPSSDVSRPSTADSSNLSNMSSPQIMDAASIQFFKTPIEETFSTWITKDLSPGDILSRHSSQRTERSSHTILGQCRSVSTVELISRSRASSYLSDLELSNGKSRSGSMSAVKGENQSAAKPLRNVTIRRNSSYSANPAKNPSKDDLRVASPSTNLSISERMTQNQKELEEDFNRFDSAFRGVTESPSVRMPRKRHSSLSSTTNVTDLGLQGAGRVVNSKQQIAEEQLSQPSTPSKATIKHQKTLPPIEDGSPKAQHETKSLDGSIDDQLTARISSILTNIPARIRLASGPEENAPEVRPNLLSSNMPLGSPSASASPVRVQRSVSSTPSITLAPAYSKISKTKPQHGDSDIKLYHLHQPGKDIPIKLFVRLVGEGGERVMVRVGGGWADLAEYLREYVSHHGRRSVSGGKIELKGLPAQSSAAVSATLSSFENGRTTPVSRSGSPTYRSGSSLGIRKIRRSSGVSSSPYTPETSSRQWAITPGSADSFSSSIHSSSKASWTEDDAPLGLAGPKSRNVEISPTKKAWVDGMLNQARQFSSEKKREISSDVDTSKVEKTRRVFLKTKAED